MRVAVGKRRSHLGRQVVHHLYPIKLLAQIARVEEVAIDEADACRALKGMAQKEAVLVLVQVIKDDNLRDSAVGSQCFDEFGTDVAGPSRNEYFHDYLETKSVCKPHSTLLSPNQRASRSAISGSRRRVHGSQPTLW